MSQRIDFSGNATVYDRRHGAVLGEDVVQRLAAAGAIQSGTNVLDIGAGTGRVAIALAALGCNVVALEPASGMVETLRTKVGALPIRLVAGEGARLPFFPGQFDVVVIARVLYLTFLRRLIDGEFSYIWNVPKTVQEECLPLLKAWSEQRFDLGRSISMPRELSWSVYCKDRCLTP